MADRRIDHYPSLMSLAVHEFRTPASVVAGYLRMLQRDTTQPLTERQRKMIEEAGNSCARLVGIIAELSDIAKLDAGSITLARHPFDVFTLLGDVAAHVHEAEDREVKLVMRGPGDGAPIQGDATRLKHAFDAVFRAILREKAGPATVVAERRLETREAPAAAVVIIADESSVQTAYETAAGVFDERRGGLGLALPLARRVFEGHGGRIWSPAPRQDDDPLTRGSAIISLPVTE